MNVPERCAVIGILDDGWEGLGDKSRRCLHEAELVIGAERTLALVRPHLSEGREWRALDGALAEVPRWVEEALGRGRKVAVLATGDPLCHGLAPWLIARLGEARVAVLPAVSTLQLAFARWKLPWQEVRIASCHARDAGDWSFAAGPGHPLSPVLRAVAQARRVAVFTSPENGPARIARALIDCGYGEEIRMRVASRLLLADEALFGPLTPQEAARREFPDPNVVLIERHGGEAPLFGLEDAEYAQRAPEKGLLTKQEARALSLAKLRLRPDTCVWDIGAGSGSVGLECARLCPEGEVWAIEKNAAEAANARENARRLRVANYVLVEGRAPQGLDEWPAPDAVFIGGSGGELPELIALALARLKDGGRLVMNFVTLENLATAIAAVRSSGFPWEVVQLQASRSKPILDMHRLAAQNPVWIVTVAKEGE
ncbi:precorrin-6y C5,15-methyltransferase (decarboxylating) subunit CbiE [Tepidiphilus sp. J10]|uniref:precorrin-6y C5,15-methyltransferase (decarboxylating) subunit CbiE n=1 Tax=Tepidiphilus sp. J10 TaxID=2502185 RepID=UPI00115F64FA|nr:precorrin-6y C5,15-methyltransferase (decarboxylating) subunit CbiE [Tepidiphilus sp. J10]